MKIAGFHLMFAILLLAFAAGPASASGQKKKKNSDVENIGNRNINKGNINFMSIEKEIAIGRQLAAEVERQVKMADDPVISEYVNRVGQNIVRNSDAKVPFTIKVIDSDEVNAFALPGGFFYVNTGLILAAGEEAELAGVMAHEIAHVAARHGAEAASKGELVNLASNPLIFLGGWGGFGVQQAAGFLIPMQFLAFSRGQEAEADYLGVQYLYKSGYDPSAFVTFFEKLQAGEKGKQVSKMFRTHPPTADRVAAAKKNTEDVLVQREEYVVTTSEFAGIKERLTTLEARNLGPQQDENRPGLRRRTSGRETGASKPEDSEESGSDTVADDRPKLKRR